MSVRTVRLVLASAGAGLALGACSVSVGGGSISESNLEETLTSEVTEQVGESPDSIDCPGDLDGEEGATLTCTLTAGDTTADIEVTVTSVDGDQVNYSWEVVSAG